MRKELRELELANGVGTVFQDKEKLMAVMYRIRVMQEFMESITHDRGRSWMEGRKQMRISLSPLEADQGYALYDRGDLTLYLEDGRKLDFYSIGGNIMPHSDFYH